MTKDRLKDLQKTSPWARGSHRRFSRQLRSSDLPNAANDGAMQLTAIDIDKDYNVAEFLTQIDLIRLLIDKIEEDAENVRQIHSKMLEPMADSKLAQELDDKTADIKKLSYDVSAKLKKMEKIQEDLPEADKANAVWRIKETQIFNITRRFREVMNVYNQEFVLHRERCKRAIVRELEITGNRRTNDELEEMLEHGFPGTFNFSIMVDIEKAKQAVNEIEARQRDITKLENSIKELHDMFIDLAQLVATQGEMIDNIEHSVSKATDYVNDAVEQVYIAQEAHKSVMKKKIVVCVILIAVVLILLLILAAYFTTQRKLLGK
ncbi:unnamed protein product [Adineta ricciae]|uniref:t-SNARE coiled-coil homology domain-containing protein n=1 Tax=Adineta ricciae TaxID=249248 RepID=A0A814FI68_ADIRI|nr:unnamed protein product [Adineta ricciae]